MDPSSWAVRRNPANHKGPNPSAPQVLLKLCRSAHHLSRRIRRKIHRHNRVLQVDQHQCRCLWIKSKGSQPFATLRPFPTEKSQHLLLNPTDFSKIISTEAALASCERQSGEIQEIGELKKKKKRGRPLFLLFRPGRLGQLC
jgi:hypothetical protein